MRFFDAPGLTGESFYRTKRSELRGTLIVLFGVGGFLYAGASQISRLVLGVRMKEPAFGLSDYMVAIIIGATAGALAGALASWPIGSAWERWHRRQRARAPTG